MAVFCIICANTFIDKDKVVHPICGHLFHEECLNKWFKSFSYCAECRQESDKQYTKIYMNFYTDTDTENVNSSAPNDKNKKCDTNELKKRIEDLENELKYTKDNLDAIQLINLKFEEDCLQEKLNTALTTLQMIENDNKRLIKLIADQVVMNTGKRNLDEFEQQMEQILIENDNLTALLNISKLRIAELEGEDRTVKFNADLKTENVSHNNKFEWVDFEDIKPTGYSNEDGAKCLELIKKQKEFQIKFDEIKKKTVYNSYAHLDKEIEQIYLLSSEIEAKKNKNEHLDTDIGKNWLIELEPELQKKKNKNKNKNKNKKY